MSEPRLRPVLGRWAAMAVATGVLIVCGRGELSGPPWPRFSALGRWARMRPPDVVAMAAIRELALATALYLLTVMTVALAGAVLGHQRTWIAASKMSPPGLRPLLALATSASVVAGCMGGVAFGAGRPVPGPTIRRIGSGLSQGGAVPPALWRVSTPAPATTTPPGATMPPSTTTAPSTTVPMSPAPGPTTGPNMGTGAGPATGPAAGLKTSPSPARTVPAGHSEVPTSRRPAADSSSGRGRPRPARRRTSSPGRPTPSTVDGEAAGKITTYVVRPGDSFWSIAAARLAEDGGGRPPDHAALARYWVGLVEANRSRLPVPGYPDVLFPGDRIELPPI